MSYFYCKNRPNTGI